MKKKISFLLLGALFIFIMAACSGNTSAPESGSSAPGADSGSSEKSEDKLALVHQSLH